jgi:hypothetical protein
MLAMPFFSQVCRLNGVVLATFRHWPDSRRYCIGPEVDWPVETSLAWCHRCEKFVEAERLPTLAELELRVVELEKRAPEFPTIDAKCEARLAELGKPMPSDLTQAALLRRCRAALAWRNSRKAPPRCLVCGSHFAIAMLPDTVKELAHPTGNGMIAINGGHAAVSYFPGPVFFDSEGLRLPD